MIICRRQENQGSQPQDQCSRWCDDTNTPKTHGSQQVNLREYISMNVVMTAAKHLNSVIKDGKEKEKDQGQST